MIKYLSVSNFYSINEEVSFELDLGKKKSTEANNVVLIYGANGSGKSTIIKVFELLDYLLNHSFSYSTKDKKFPFVQHIANKKEKTNIYIEYIKDDKVYKYSIELDEYKIYSEKLETQRGKVLLHREGTKVLKAIKMQKVLEDNLKDNISILSLANTFKEYQKEDIFYRLYSPLDNFSDDKVEYSIYDIVLISAKYTEKDKLLDLLKIADVEIVDIEIVYKDDRVVDLFFIHKFGDIQEKINYKYESTGTIKLIALSNDILYTFNRTIVIDEIDTHLHFSIVEYILSLYKNSKIQLICTAHNHMFISKIDKNSLWFTQKENGSTKLYSAGDFEDIKDDMDLAKLYEIGRFGAVPRKLYGKDDG